MKRGTVVSLFVALVVLALAGAAGAAIAPDQIKQSVAAEAWAAENPQACALLDSPKAASLMDGLLLKLAVLCGRGDLLGGVLAEEGEMPGESRDVLGVDVLVNNPATDSGSSRTQSETSVARNETTGVLCSGYNDSFHGVTQGTGYTGFSSSTDGGATWTDHGAIGAASFGDPSVFWRRSDGHFYIGAIHSSGMGLWDLGTDCTTVAFKSVSHSSSGDDKELYAVDNNPANAHYGRIYMAWTDFNAGGRIFGTFSDNGTTWSAPVALSGSTDDYQGAWPAVAPNGDIYVTWVKWAPYPTGPLDVELVRSTNGGVSYAPVTSPATGKVNPQAATPTSSCGRPALNGNIRYLPSPQVAVGPDGAVHVVYSYDPDGLNTGDVINVYYRRSTNNGTSWDTEVRLNDDATTRDQFFPSVSVGATNIVSAAWYDRRDDAGNLNFKYYQRMSFNGGVTWGASAPLSDVASPVILDPNLATCYHGDYDTQIQSSTAAVIVWADDRTVTLADPNVWNDTVAISTDFLVTSDPVTRSVCAPTAATYTVNVLQFSGFTEPVTLAATGNPAGSTVGFSANPVTPPGTSTMTVGTAGVATGSSTITVTGTSSPSAIVHSTDVTLSVFAGAPAAANLTAPANGAINIPLRPAFTWTAAAGAEDYLLEVASDPGFATIVYTATVAGTTQTPGTDLPSNTHLYWRVTANNPCGTMVSTVFNFSTVALPGDCAVGSVPNVLYDYGFEAGAGGWTHSGTGDSWAISTTSPHSGTSHFHANDPAVVSDQRLVSPAVVLPTGQNPVVIKFWHTPNLEPSGATACYDGGILEVSTNGGTTWTQVLAASILVGPYTGTVSSSFGNPLAGLQAWCGTSAYMQSIADITAYAGQTAQFRLRLGSDSSVTLPGWNVDDVVVQSCQLADTMPFIDGFESGDTSAWSSTLP